MHEINEQHSWKRSRYPDRSERICFHKISQHVKNNPIWIWLFTIILFVCIGYFILIYCCLFQRPKENTLTGWENLAHFGDSFGALSAVFSGLAFAGLLYTIYLQRQDTSETNKRYEDTQLRDQFFQIFHLFIERAASHTPFQEKEEFESNALKKMSRNKESLSNASLYHMLKVEASLFFDMIIMIRQCNNLGIKESLSNLLSSSLSVNQKRNYYTFLFISNNFELMRNNVHELVNQGLLIQSEIDGDTLAWGKDLGDQLRKNNGTEKI